MRVRTLFPVLLMSSVLVACGGSTGASLSMPTSNTTTNTTTGGNTTGTGTSTGTGTGSTTIGGTSGTGTTTGGNTTGGTTSGTDTTTTTNPRLLTRSVVDAEYSNALERLITVSSSPDNTLSIINPSTGEQQAVPLSLAPTSLALSPDGKTAVVGHKHGVTHINLQTASVLDFYDNIGFDVFDIALGANGIAYATPANNLWGVLESINLGTGQVQGSVNVSQMSGSYVQIVPSLNALYVLDMGLPSTLTDLFKTNLATPPSGLYDSPYNGDYDLGGKDAKGFWVTEDGAYILTAGETLFRTAATQDQDMLYQRSVSDNDNDSTTTLIHADHSQKAGKFVVILDKGITGMSSDYRLKTYSSPQLALLEEKKLSEMSLDKSSDPVIPQFVFFNSDGTKRYAVLKQGTGTYLLAF